MQAMQPRRAGDLRALPKALLKAAALVMAASHFPSEPRKAPSTAASPLAHGC